MVVLKRELHVTGLETRVRKRTAVDAHRRSRQVELERLARGERVARARGQRADQQRQGDRGVGMNGDLLGVGGELAPAARLFEARSGGAAEMRHVGDDLQGVAVPADAVVEELGLHARLVDEVLGRAAAEDNGSGPRMADHDVGRLDDVADHVDQPRRRHRGGAPGTGPSRWRSRRWRGRRRARSRGTPP